MELIDTKAGILEHNYAAMGKSSKGDISAYYFSCTVIINRKTHTLRREVGTQGSFYEPWFIDGVNVWFALLPLLSVNLEDLWGKRTVFMGLFDS